MTQDIIFMLLINSVVFSALLIILFGVRRLFRDKLSAIMQLALWMVVVVKLVFPFGFESQISPLNWFATAPAQEAVSDMPHTKSNVEPVFEPTASLMEPIQNMDAYRPNDSYIAPKTIESDKPASKPLHWTVWALIVWGAGFAAVMGGLLISRLKVHRHITRSGMRVPENVQRQLDSCRRELCIKRHVSICMQSVITMPAITGVLRPVLILPFSVQGMDDKSLRHIFLHELIHYKSGDLILIRLMNLLSCVYWFNPLVWLCFSKMRDDMETLCDQRVLSHMDEQGQSGYLQTVLSFTGETHQSRLFAALSFSCGRVKMERRIRGMFQRRKTKRSTAAAAILLAALMLAVSVLTACQPTPEKAVVVNKGNETFETIINQTVSPNNHYEVPQTWAETFQRENTKLVVETDSNIVMPNVDEYPVTAISSDKFTQEQVDRLVQVLFQGKTIYYNSSPLTKSELEERLIEAKAALANKKANSESNESSIGDLEENIESIEESIKLAPETIENAVGSTKLLLNEYGEMRIDLRASLGKDKDATLTIINSQNSNPYTCFTHFVNTNNNSGYQNFDDWQLSADNLKLRLTEEGAVNQAMALLKELEITEMEVAAVFPGVSGGSEGSDVSNNAQCYMVYFTRTVNGVPAPFARMEAGRTSNVGNVPSDIYSPSWAMEQILVCIDDTGVVEFEWQSPAKILRNVSENVTLMPFTGLEDIFEKQMFVKYVFIENDDLLANRTYHIDKVKLGMTRIKSKDNEEEFLLVPAWFFFGSTQDNYDMEAVTKRMVELDESKAEENIKWYKDHNGQKLSDEFESLLVINAIDGSIIG